MKSYKIFKTDIYYTNDRCVPLFRLLQDCITYAFEGSRVSYKEFYCNLYINLCDVLLHSKFINIESYTFFVDYLMRCTQLDSYIFYHAINAPCVCFCCGVVVVEPSNPSSCLYHIADDLLYSGDDTLIDSDITLYDWLNTFPTYLPFDTTR